METMDIHEVMKYLPHRYPFLLVDKVLECNAGENLKAIKNVTFNEPFFQGHFPDHPVFPGVLILEAMAQSLAILAFATSGGYPADDMLYLFVGIDKARFKRKVQPGDQLVIDIELIRLKKKFGKFRCVATVDGEIACEAELMGVEREMDV